MTEKYDITDYLKDDKELQKAVIEEFLKENAELKAENMEIKTSYINFIAKLKREMITKDDIQDLKDTAKRFVEERNSLRKENAELKAENDTLKSQLDFEVQKKEVFETENERLKSCLQEIKAIAETCISKDACFECKYSDDCYIDDAEIPTYDICKLILQKITKAESEVNG